VGGGLNDTTLLDSQDLTMNVNVRVFIGHAKLGKYWKLP